MSDQTNEPEEAWAYPPSTETCASCETEASVPAQAPESLRAGVLWECGACGARNLLKDDSGAISDDMIVECASCHSTYTSASPDAPQVEGDSWTCPGCSAVNQRAADSASGETSEVRP